ncbi:AraC family transcriptional regulator [Desulfosediminicola ganghwensis]|uniref:AraC family transcriptional regulator n=1 Tax=Desulfosediminicola ganghwensis TaxID=2569540 RepID=UPI0010AB6A11|nr:AraC family transcriptional regulator [Desulfosediminicola ganghwensis]
MDKEQATIYRAEKLENLLVFQARYQRFKFGRHTHEDFALGIMEHGVQKFYCRGEARFATPGSLISVNPDEIHDGMSADQSEFHYKVIYLPVELLQNIGNEMVAPRSFHTFKNPVTNDPEVAAGLTSLFALLEGESTDLLEMQTLLFGLLALMLERHGTERRTLITGNAIHTPIQKACTFIDDMVKEEISLDDIAAAAGLSRYHFLRLFRDEKGISPWSYLLHKRLQLARTSIRLGTSLTDAALDAGFSDQSHMSRRFKATYGITPGQYRQAYLS